MIDAIDGGKIIALSATIACESDGKYSSLNIFMAHKKSEEAQKHSLACCDAIKKQLKYVNMVESCSVGEEKEWNFKKLEYQRHVEAEKAPA